MNIKETMKKKIYIVAEISANHKQDYDEACRLIEAASIAGADAVKIQCYRPGNMTINVKNDTFKIQHGKWEGKYLWDLYEKAYLPWEWIKSLNDLAHELGIDFYASVFDIESADFMDQFDPPAYKIASFEINDKMLIDHVSKKEKTVIFSNGVASQREREYAIKTCKDTIMLECTSDYPAKKIDLMNMHFHADGISDHTIGIAIPAAAAALGARMIEKHLTLSSDSIDAEFSLKGDEFKLMVKSIRQVEESLQILQWDLFDRNWWFKRSMMAIKDIQKGEKFTSINVKSLRPNIGSDPRNLDGTSAQKDYKKGDAV